MTADEFLTRLRRRFGAELWWRDGFGGSRQVLLGGRQTVLGNRGSWVNMIPEEIEARLADLGLPANALD